MSLTLNNITLLYCDTLNNNCIYSKSAIEEALKNYQKQVESGSAVGQYRTQLQMALGEFTPSHKIKSIKLCGSAVIADVEILDTSTGKGVQSMLKGEGTELIFGITGEGKLKKSTTNKESYEIIEFETIDSFDIIGIIQ